MSDTTTNGLMQHYVTYCARHNFTSSYGTTPNQDVCQFCQMERDLAAARAKVEELRRAGMDAAHKLEQCRIWGGMDWKWHPLPAHQAWKILRDALAREEK